MIRYIKPHRSTFCIVWNPLDTHRNVRLVAFLLYHNWNSYNSQEIYEFDGSNLKRHPGRCTAMHAGSRMIAAERCLRAMRFLLSTNSPISATENADFRLGWNNPLCGETTMRKRIVEAFEHHVTDNVSSRHYPVITFDSWTSRRHRWRLTPAQRRILKHWCRRSGRTSRTCRPFGVDSPMMVIPCPQLARAMDIVRSLPRVFSLAGDAALPRAWAISDTFWRSLSAAILR